MTDKEINKQGIEMTSEEFYEICKAMQKMEKGLQMMQPILIEALSKSQLGWSEEIDFERGTWTFKMPDGFVGGSGDYRLMRIADFEACRLLCLKIIEELECLTKQ